MYFIKMGSIFRFILPTSQHQLIHFFWGSIRRWHSIATIQHFSCSSICHSWSCEIIWIMPKELESLLRNFNKRHFKQKTLDFQPVLYYCCTPPNFVVEFWYYWLEKKFCRHSQDGFRSENFRPQDCLLQGQKSFFFSKIKNNM